MVHQFTTDSPEQHSSDFEFRSFPSPRSVTLPKRERSIDQMLLIAGVNYVLYIHVSTDMAQLAGTVEYTDCTSAEW